MSEHLPRRTKIVATVGPASWDPETLRALIEAGADVLRLNFSHSDEEKHVQIVRDIRAASLEVGREVAILGDLPGPKLRVGDIPDGVVRLFPGSTVTLVHGEGSGTAERIPIPRAEIIESLGEGAIVYMADGSIRLKVKGQVEDGVEALVEVGGPLSSNKGLNLPGVDTGIEAVSEADLRWIDFSVEQELDLLAVSFVKSAADLAPVTERLESLGSDIPVIAKIEKPEATDQEALDGILEAVGAGIMIARGDLGIEVPIAEVPSLQKRLISQAGEWSKLSITATQMLASMVSAPRPTRAEVTDVATAISDGTDAVMLS
ncbi:MAG: pyruvate kinase, partial [Solirubrobacterales bacterium]